MKKKFLLAVIPALMVLSSCAGAGQKVEVKNDNLFVEDTLAHEEIFGEAKLEMEGFRAPRKSPELSPEPMYGVQYQVTASYIHMRLIAAVSLPDLSVSVQWTRTMYKGHTGGADAGSAFKTAAPFESTKAYTSLANGSEDPLTISAFNTEYGTSYDRFVVYTMLNIPKSGYDDYSIMGVVSIDGVASSNAIAANVGQTAFATFATSRDDHFISGRFNGVHNEIAAKVSKSDISNNAEYDEIDLQPGDTFALVYRNKTNNVLLLNGASRLSGIASNLFNATKKTATVKYAGKYSLFLNGSDQVFTTARNVLNNESDKHIYVDVNVWWWEGAWTAVYVYKGNIEDDDGEWFYLDTPNSGNDFSTKTTLEIYSSSFYEKGYTDIAVCRMANGKSLPADHAHWDGVVYNSTSTALLTDSIQDCVYVYLYNDALSSSMGSR